MSKQSKNTHTHTHTNGARGGHSALLSKCRKRETNRGRGSNFQGVTALVLVLEVRPFEDYFRHFRYFKTS